MVLSGKRVALGASDGQCGRYLGDAADAGTGEAPKENYCKSIGLGLGLLEFAVHEAGYAALDRRTEGTAGQITTHRQLEKGEM